jgi:hypothetical protein
VNLNRCIYRYQTKKTDDLQIMQELCQLAECQPRWGCGKMTDYLRHQGLGWPEVAFSRPAGPDASMTPGISVEIVI